jgi:thiamine kinase-like enzyme
VKQVSSGLIHDTYEVSLDSAAKSCDSSSSSKSTYIVQRFNRKVFQDAEAVCRNAVKLAAFIHKSDPDYTIITPLSTIEDIGSYVAEHEGHSYRVFPFVAESRTARTVDTPSLAAAAARAFARLTKKLSAFDASSLHLPIPNFHNLILRYDQFQDAVNSATASFPDRLGESSELVAFLRSQHSLVEAYGDMLCDPDFKVRVMHHDTKISNVLFDARSDEALCVIDLDTVMPGYVVSDVGDMIRTYCCSQSEESADFEGLGFKDEIYFAIARAYAEEMGDELSETERNSFIFAGKYMIYMQALRFLTDYLQGDIYYGSAYPAQNLVRAGNQVALLKQLIKAEPFLRENINGEVL